METINEKFQQLDKEIKEKEKQYKKELDILDSNKSEINKKKQFEIDEIKKKYQNSIDFTQLIDKIYCNSDIRMFDEDGIEFMVIQKVFENNYIVYDGICLTKESIHRHFYYDEETNDICICKKQIESNIDSFLNKITAFHEITKEEKEIFQLIQKLYKKSERKK